MSEERIKPGTLVELVTGTGPTMILDCYDGVDARAVCVWAYDNNVYSTEVSLCSLREVGAAQKLKGLLAELRDLPLSDVSAPELNAARTELKHRAEVFQSEALSREPVPQS